MIVDGKAISAEILARTKVRVDALGREVVVRAISVAPSAATESYLRIKEHQARAAGMYLEVVRMESDESAKDVIHKITLGGSDAIIVQLPLPSHITTQEVCDAIPVAQDADVLSTAARKKFEAAEIDALLPPVVGAIAEIFERYNVDLEGKKAVVIGRGWLVGAPAATWLMQQGARVTTLELGANLSQELQDADMIISGAGAAHIIKPYMIKDDVVLIDAGTSESSGVIAGDADPACATKCAVFTPVPGGVGPIVVAKLFENAMTLAEREDLTR